MTRAAVIGAGAWGTALADVLARNGHDVTLWALETDVVESVNTSHENARFLQGYLLSPALRATHSLPEALDGAALVSVATPAQHLRSVLRGAGGALLPHAVMCVASKGIERETLALMSDVVAAEAPDRAVVALSEIGRAHV